MLQLLNFLNLLKDQLNLLWVNDQLMLLFHFYHYNLNSLHHNYLVELGMDRYIVVVQLFQLHIYQLYLLTNLYMQLIPEIKHQSLGPLVC